MQPATPYPSRDERRRRDVYAAVLRLDAAGARLTVRAVHDEAGRPDRLGGTHAALRELRDAAILEWDPETRGTMRLRARPLVWVRLLTVEAT